MNRKIRTALLTMAAAAALLSACGSPGYKTGPEQGDTESLRQWAEGFTEKSVKEKRLKGGLSLMIYSGGEVIYAGGSGWADRDKELPLTEDSPMPVGSISKIFTSVAVMKLAEDGKIDLDKPAGYYLPRLKLAGDRQMDFTVRDLLTHHSGIPTDIFAGWTTETGGTGHMEGLYPLLEGLPLAAEPGTLHSYANTGFTLLGLIIEEASGEPYEKFIRNSIFEAAGMENSLVYPGERNLTLPLGYSGKEQLPVPLLRDIPAGGLAVSAGDMGRFIQALLGGEGTIIGKDYLDRMLTPQNRNVPIDRDFEIGLGFWLIDPLGTGSLTAAHGGDLPPYHSVLITMPGLDLAVFAAVNDGRKDGTAAMECGMEAAEVLLEWSGHQKKAAAEKGGFVTPSAEEVERFSGTYGTVAGLINVRPHGEAFRMELEGKKLFFAPRENGRWGVEYRLFNRITIPVPDLAVMEFDMYEEAGKSWMGVWMKGVYMGTFSKLDDAGYPGVYSDYIGTYTVAGEETPADTGFKAVDDISIRQEDGRYLLSLKMFGRKLDLALRAEDGSRAFTDGTGRGMGDLLVFGKQQDGSVTLKYSGLVLMKN